MKPYLVPMGAFGAVVTLALLLIGVVILRPWSGPDSSWRTHMNQTDEPYSGYTRSVQTFVSPEGAAPIGVWSLAEDADLSIGGGEGGSLFVVKGCASCHGLDARGGTVGPDLMDVSASDVRRETEKGPEGMPAFHEVDIADEEVEAITGYVMALQEALIAEGPSTVAPLPTPAPAPTPELPSATATAAPSVATPEPTIPGDAPEPTTTPEPAAPSPEPPAAPTGIAFVASAATITVDGDASDWADIPGAVVPLQHIQRIPGKEMGDLAPLDATFKVAVDSERVYVLLEVPDDYDFDPDDGRLSAAMAVMFRIDPPAAPHMGAEEENQKKSLGMVDIWHWELDCGAGQVAGGGGVAGGNDRACNLDDEYAKTPKDLEDDDSLQAENSLVGVWEHSARAGGNGAAGTWVFEMSRPLQTGDPHDAQLQRGTTAAIALAYWDPDETPDGWTDLGHLQSASGGWIEVALPAG